MRQAFQFGLLRITVLLCVSVLASASAAVAQAPQQQQPIPSATPADQKGTPASEQQQPETPASKPVALEKSVPGKVPVPKAVPSMMPHEPGDELDRIVAIVNGQVILDSDVNEEHRFEAIQPYPDESGTPTRDGEIERLVNRDLILQQAKLQSDVTVTDAEVETEIDGLRKTLPECKRSDCASDAGWARYLATHGFSVEEFRQRWEERMQVLAFIQERFGAATTVSGAQIREFYNNVMIPQYKKAGTKPAPLASVEDRIRNILEQQQVNNLLRDWLQSLRAQGNITVLHPGEEAP